MLHKLHRLIYKELHSKMEHLGRERVYQLAKERVLSSRMEEEILHFVTIICSCVKKTPPHIKPVASLGTITSTQSVETVSTDHGSDGYECLLVVTDYFTHYTQVYLTRNKALCTTTKRMFSDFTLRSGIPQHILHDQSKEFDNKHFHQLTKLCGVKQLRTTQYHLQTDGAIERMNSLICSVLKTLTSKEKTA